MEKTIITAALTGAFPCKKDNPNVPITPQEIAEQAYECYEAGAAVVHLHMRDNEEKGTMDVERFRETKKLIEAKCDVILNLTTSGDLDATDETRQIHLKELKPEMASFDAGTMNWGHTTVFYNTPTFLESLGQTMLDNNVKPEIECFDAGMVYNALYYIKKGLIKTPAHFQICLGAPGGSTSTVENLVYLKNLLPKDATWSAFGVGKDHLTILGATIAFGGHVRVGLEDNIFYAKNQLAKSNAEFVHRTVRILKECNKKAATPAEAREILQLNKK